MAPLSDSESVTAIALNYNNSKRGDILAETNISVSKTENSSFLSSSSAPTSSPLKQLKQAANQAGKQVTENECDRKNDANREEDGEDRNEDEGDKDKDKDKDEIEIKIEIEQPKRASSGAKTLKVEAKKISRCLSSNETRTFQQQKQQQEQFENEHDKLEVAPQDKRSTDVKGTKEAPESISRNPSSSFGNTNQLSVKPTKTNSAKSTATSKVSTAQQQSSPSCQRVNVDGSKLKATDINGSGTFNRATTSTKNRKGSISGLQTQPHQQQRQMFSLKQLAINPRSLTKKRCSLQSGASSSNQDTNQQQNNRVFPKLFDCSQNVNHSQSLTSSNECPEQTVSSSSGSSVESATNCKPQVKRRNSKQQDLIGDSENNGELDEELEGNKEKSLFLDDPHNLSDEHLLDDNEDDDDDNDDDDDDEDDDDAIFSNSDSDSVSDLDHDVEGNTTDEELKSRQDRVNGIIRASRDNKKQKECRKKRSRRRQNLLRRSSCCNCEQLINEIDCDGLPVTDVDLVSYKDLCQMEQQAHHMRTTGHQGRQHLDTPGCASTLSRTNYGWQSGGSGGSIRRSSLQEESGAYYELCTSGDEQLIRQKYVWFPPSLRQLNLVDKFFENFPKDKIPYTSPGSQMQNLSGNVINKPDQFPTNQQQQSQGNAKSNVGPNRQQTGVATSLAASSYRDEQISSQLPRQDISLDYCSYPMTDSSRAAYMQFVDKRNSQALDVGNVVQVRLNSFSQKSATTIPHLTFGQQTHPNVSSGWQTPTSDHQNNNNNNNKEFQRRVSTVSQSAVALMSLNQVGQHEQLGQHGSGGSGAQRCRRCLVRFDDKQLAVMAPNFVIGSTPIYRSSVIPSTSVVIEGQPASAVGAGSATTSISGTMQVKLRDKQTVERDRNSSTAAATNVALYHPNCFTCSTCKEFLVDLVYCLRDNKLYCVRHYGESLRPRCSWCQEVS